MQNYKSGLAYSYTYLQTSKIIAKDLHQAKGSLNCLCIVTKGRRNATHLSRKSLCSIIGRRKSRAWIMLCFGRRLWYLSYVERTSLGNLFGWFLHTYCKFSTKFCSFLFSCRLVVRAQSGISGWRHVRASNSKDSDCLEDSNSKFYILSIVAHRILLMYIQKHAYFNTQDLNSNVVYDKNGLMSKL